MRALLLGLLLLLGVAATPAHAVKVERAEIHGERIGLRRRNLDRACRFEGRRMRDWRQSPPRALR